MPFTSILRKRCNNIPISFLTIVKWPKRGTKIMMLLITKLHKMFVLSISSHYFCFNGFEWKFFTFRWLFFYGFLSCFLSSEFECNRCWHFCVIDLFSSTWILVPTTPCYSLCIIANLTYYLFTSAFLLLLSSFFSISRTFAFSLLLLFLPYEQQLIADKKHRFENEMLQLIKRNTDVYGLHEFSTISIELNWQISPERQNLSN